MHSFSFPLQTWENSVFGFLSIISSQAQTIHITFTSHLHLGLGTRVTGFSPSHVTDNLFLYQSCSFTRFLQIGTCYRQCKRLGNSREQYGLRCSSRS